VSDDISIFLDSIERALTGTITTINQSESLKLSHDLLGLSGQLILKY